MDLKWTRHIAATVIMAVGLALAATAVRAADSVKDLGALAGDQKVSFAVTLPLRDQAGLLDTLGHIYRKGDPAFHHFLSRDEFVARFAPTRAQYQGLIAYAAGHGLTVERTHAGRTVLDVVGRADLVGSLFDVKFERRQIGSGKEFHEPTSTPRPVPALLAMGAHVIGLSNRPVFHTNIVRGGALDGATRVNTSNGTGPGGTYSPNDIRTAYSMNTAETGAGRRIALFELSSADYTDAAQYAAYFDLPAPVVNLTNVDGGTTDYSGADEVILDIDMETIMAPDATSIDVYTAPNSEQGLLDDYTKIAEVDVDDTVSSSWGLNEGDVIAYEPGLLSEEETVFEEMALQGQSMFAAAGDTGSYENGYSLSVIDPSSNPYVTAVGGTSLSIGAGSTWASESTWNDWTEYQRAIAGGGGISEAWTIPGYQASVQFGGGPGQYSTTMRDVPDVSLNADVYPGYGIYLDSNDSGGQPGWYEFGGTSAASPLWAGMIADVDAARKSAGLTDIGFANPAIYDLAEGPDYANDFHDIADGSNNFYYVAVKGFDNATGWGSFEGGNIYTDLLTYGAALKPPVVAATASDAQVSLSWNTSPWATSYNIFRGTASGGEGSTPIAAATGTAYPDTGVSNGISYYYVVTAVCSFGTLNVQSIDSNEVSATPSSTLPPGAPALVAVSGTGQVALSWTATPTATAYCVYRGTQSGVESSELVSNGAATAYTDTAVTNGDTYFYTVTAVSSNGTSGPSNQATGTPLARPSAVTGLSVTSSSGAVLLSWSANSSATSFNIYEGTTPGGESSTPVATTCINTILITGLTNLQTYYFKVAGVNAFGAGPQSTEASNHPVLETILYAFDPFVNLYDGYYPVGALIQASNGEFYGTTSYGGSGGYGTVFEIDSSGAESIVHNFGDGTIVNDGMVPYDSLIIGNDGNFYGTTYDGGTYGDGTVFRMTPAGVVTILYSFGTITNDGLHPTANLVLGIDGNFYGTTTAGGSTTGIDPSGQGFGTVFQVTTSGAEKILHNFGDGTVTDDGKDPWSPLIQASNRTLYGTTEDGGSAGAGTVFSMSTSGSEVVLHSFMSGTVTHDGAVPVGPLVLDGGDFYGTTYYGGSTVEQDPYGYGYGTAFRMTSTGALTILHNFADGTTAFDWSYPESPLILASDGYLYGATSYAGAVPGAGGDAFRMDTSGNVTILHAFGDASLIDDALDSCGGLIQGADGAFYGTAFSNMEFYGTVLRLDIGTGTYPPAPPAGLTATAGNAQVSLDWTASPDATGYNVYRATASGAEGTAAVGTSTAAYYTDTGLTNGVEYFYTVAAVNDGGTSAQSTEAFATPEAGLLSAPTGLAATAGNAQVGLSWSSSTGATSYNVYRATSSGAEGSTTIGTASTTAYTDTGLSNGTTYFYKISAVNGEGTSAQSSETSATPEPPAPAAPSGLTATPGGAQISLSWTASTGAASYNVYRATTSGAEGTTAIGTATTTTYTDTGLTNGVTYFYKVAAVNGGGTSPQSTEASATPVAPIPAAPTGLTATPGNTQVSLTWTASTWATSYSIYRGTASGAEGSTAIGTVTSTAYTDTGLTNGGTYFYKVSAANGSGTSPLSNEASATPAPTAPPPAGLIAIAGDTQISLFWTASAGASSYNIYRGTVSGGEGTTPVGSSAGPSYSDSGLTNGIVFYYKVAAVNGGGTSAFSNEASATPSAAIPLAPTGLTATAGTAEISLAWTTSSRASSYNIYRATSTGAEGTVPIATATSPSYTDTGATNGTYYYKVAALNGAGTSAQSNEASASVGSHVPAAPTGLTATAGNTQVLLSWTGSSGATSYNIYRGTASGAESSTAAATGITTGNYTDTGLTNGITYFYKVAAVNGVGTSALSSEASATPALQVPAAPTGLIATAGNTQVSLSWT
ncbi:MAG: choice-of-anchor tandem repeat GloVer-containing protein, partial [Capsulimonadaceae bacterium]